MVTVFLLPLECGFPGDGQLVHTISQHRGHDCQSSLQPTTFTCHLLMWLWQCLICTWSCIGPWDPTYYKDEEGAPKQVYSELHDIKSPHLQGGSHSGCPFPEWPSLESPAHCPLVHSRVLGTQSLPPPWSAQTVIAKHQTKGLQQKLDLSQSCKLEA